MPISESERKFDRNFDFEESGGYVGCTRSGKVFGSFAEKLLQKRFGDGVKKHLLNSFINSVTFLRVFEIGDALSTTTTTTFLSKTNESSYLEINYVRVTQCIASKKI